MRRRWLAFGLLGALVAGASSSLPASAQPIEIGVLPYISARTLLTQYQPLRDYLNRYLTRRVQVSTAPNWTTFYRRTVNYDYDLVVTAANMARVAQLDSGYVPLVAYTPPIRGLVVVAKARPIRAIGELRGRRLALSNPQSLVTLRGMKWLAEQGLTRDVDFQTVDTPTDDSVGNLVVRGDCIAAMLSGGEFMAIPEDIRSQLQWFVNFADVPGFIIAGSPRLDSALALEIRKRLLDFARGSDEGRAFFAATGFGGMIEATTTVLEPLDVYGADTRRLFAASR